MLYDDSTIKRVLRAVHTVEDWRNIAAKNDANLSIAYRWIPTARDNDMWDSSPRKQREGKRNAKVTDAHVDCLLDRIDENCYLALDEMVDALEARFEVKVSLQTIKHYIDGRMDTIKKTHCDSNYRNLPENKILRRDYIVDLLAYKSEGKKTFYVDETNFDLWYSRSRDRSLKGKRAVDKNTASKGSNIHVIACISEEGLAYSEKRFGSFTSENCNELFRRLLTHIARTTRHDNVVLVADNAPCHANIEDVFEEEPFADAKFLRLGPYCPMLNPIENCFSSFKAMAKRFLARHRSLQVPPHRTIKAIEKNI
ncbi:hypothetical protein PI124_g10592 [Phytophthora idaei]|nr:hypothetical protein PI125_g8846 [Phytophthora idaei]KAG3157581.1 hypothetical protein PI126_g8249 [Phytophthora idaei]KAG3244638.1 hypothetical protein PI124_g10592 [Phytophthora idaei]